MPLRANLGLPPPHWTHCADATVADELLLQWEDFFGPTVDLAPMLLDIYDALFQQKSETAADGGSRAMAGRPLSVASSSSSSAIDSFSSSSSSSLSLVRPAEEDGERSSSGVSEASAEAKWSAPRPRYCTEPNLSYVERVTIEIVDTERTYVHDLQEIIEGYLNYLKTGCLKVDIGNQNIADLFGNIEDIWRFNKEFLKELELCNLNPASVAKCFVKHKAGFSVYTLYCTNYPQTVSVLTELMRKEETAEIFKVRQCALGHLLPLGSFLLKPVQRILKYHLLLQNMCKHSTTEGGSYERVVEALSTMTAIAHHINDMKRKHEHAVRVQEIQSLLYGWRGEDLTTYGELIAEGTFRVFGAKGVRHVFLFDRMLLISKKRGEDVSLNYKAHIMCSNLMLIESVSGEPLCFHVVPFDSPRVQYTLQARNLEQKREWSLQLKRVILENYNVAIPSHARDLVMQLGQNKTEEDCLLVERGTAGKRAHSAPEYLERRKQEKERRKIDSFSKTLRARRGSHLKSKVLGMSDDWREFERKNVSFGRKVGKKGKGWRRKSEPCELICSQDSLTTPSPSLPSTPPPPAVSPVTASTTAVIVTEHSDYVSFYLPSNSLPSSPSQIIYNVPSCSSTPHCHCKSSSLDLKISPTEPAVWLKQQQLHLPKSNSLKAGSLPRSFQLNNNYKQRHLLDRPFTIASDKPSQSDLNLDDFERYMVDSAPVQNHTFKFPVDKESSATHEEDEEEEDEEDEDDDEVEESTEDLSGSYSSVHPQHRIYRPSLSRSSLRSLVANLSSRLTGSSKMSGEEIQQQEKVANRLLVTLVHAYSKMTKRSPRSNKTSNSQQQQQQQSQVVLIHRQGSPSIGARMAKPLTHQVDYAVPCIRRTQVDSNSYNTSNNNNNNRPESLLSLAGSPHWLPQHSARNEQHDEQQSEVKEESEDEEEQVKEIGEVAVSKEETRMEHVKVEDEINVKEEENNEIDDEKVVSFLSDSYYERSFEAIDTLVLDEVSEEEPKYTVVVVEKQETAAAVDVDEEEGEVKAKLSPSRVKGAAILETMKHLEECCKKYQSCSRDELTGLKPIRERCRALQERALSPPSLPSSSSFISSGSASSPVLASSDAAANALDACESSPVPTGWVKQVVEKFQKDQ